MKYLILLSFNTSLLISSCFGLGCANKKPENKDSSAVTEPLLLIDTDVRFQTIHNFGASDAWTCQFIGLWPDVKRNQIADLLFSTEVDEIGQPKGIGLSLWRFNIGAGSTSQNNISDDWRSTESFLNTDGTYDWTKQAGQRWLLKAAQKRGVNQFLGFTNSPPVSLTKNGRAYSYVNNQANIDPKNYLAFSNFLTRIVQHFQIEEGVNFNYLSPFNEPQWDWTGSGQEGCPYTNREMYDIVKKLDSVITVQQLSVKILIGEAGKLNYLYEDADKTARANQIHDFYTENSPLYIGSLTNVEKSISGHSYFTEAPVNSMVTIRQILKNKLTEASVPLEFWQSEYCVLGDQEEMTGNGKDLGINTALYVARLIHEDLTVANASAWHWWLAVSAYDYKDGLIFVDKNKTDGNVEDSKLLWALGNFSRFIRPGSTRLGITGQCE